ncbi:MAG TPA: glycosyltransferase family 39 protein, partial [Candidatus Polarisedimenticolia bacterium]|nr:glycosyltransferase family 39 protein [Candidatus Polarisedimenticolia bacterium]
MPRLQRLRGAARGALLSPAFVPSCLAGAVAVRLALVLAVDARPVDDFSWYWQRALDVSEGLGIVDGGRPTAYWPPGYPFLLGALFRIAGPSLALAQIANIVFYVLAMLLCLRLARRTAPTEEGARLVLPVLALWPNQAAYAALTATEPLFLLLMLAGVERTLSAGSRPADRGGRLAPLAAAGLAFGAATLTRPQAALLPPVLIAGMALAGRWKTSPGARGAVRAAAECGAILAVMGLVLLPWTVRNLRVFGAPVLVANSGGVNLWIGNNAKATGGYRETPIPGAEAAKDEKHRDDLAARAARLYIQSHPWRFVSMIPSKAAHLYLKDVEGFYWLEVAMGRGDGAPSGRPLWVLKLVAQSWWMALLASFAAAMVSWARGRPAAVAGPWAPAGILVIGYFTAVFVVLFGSSRFHFPFAPLIGIYAAAWLASVLL